MENEEKNQTEQSDKSRSVWRELWDYAKIIIAVFVIAFLLGHFVYINARVPSGSMEETIMTGDRVFGNRLAYIKDDPEVLILDEATSALDNDTEAAIMESINRLHGRKTLIIIAHRLQTIEKCDIVYRVEDGRAKIERGNL